MFHSYTIILQNSKPTMTKANLTFCKKSSQRKIKTTEDVVEKKKEIRFFNGGIRTTTEKFGFLVVVLGQQKYGEVIGNL